MQRELDIPEVTGEGNQQTGDNGKKISKWILRKIRKRLQIKFFGRT